MNPAYLALANKRVTYLTPQQRKKSTFWAICTQPEDYGVPVRYNFKQWVSPYTAGANNVCNGIAVVLQDWSGSEDGSAL